MSFTEIALILFVALILFGPEDLPVIARTLGKMVFQVRRFMNEITKEFQDAIDTPSNVINDVLKDQPGTSKKSGAAKKEDEPEEELLTYEESKQEPSAETTKDANPLAELPSDIISYSKESQAGE
jgi:sec-independent protein translocase protein TatB